MNTKKRLKPSDYVRNFLKLNPTGTHKDFLAACGKTSSRRTFDRIKSAQPIQVRTLADITQDIIAGSGKTADILPPIVKSRKVDPVKSSEIKDKKKFARDFLKTSPDATYTQFVEKFGKVLSDCLFYLERKKIQGGDKEEVRVAQEIKSTGGLNIPLLIKMFIMNNPEATFGDYEEAYPDITLKQSAFYYLKKTLQNSGLVMA